MQVITPWTCQLTGINIGNCFFIEVIIQFKRTLAYFPQIQNIFDSFKFSTVNT